jgi:mono/diheme cytochrome c family protein
MSGRLFISVSLIVLAGGVLAGAVSVDSRRGEQIFETHACIRCHSINGKGGKAAPDLGRRIGREYTPASFAALMWNHAPAMWSSMGQQGLELKPLTQQDAGDLFGYFYSIRFFDKAADAARGKRLFTSNHCSECHAISESAGGVAKPVANWQSLGHPIELASAMWRHSTNMRQAFAAKGFDWPALSGQDLADILLYVRNLPSTRGKPIDFEASGENGKALFDSKGCIKCHTGKLDLAPRLKGKTLNDIAAAMWNHSPSMGTPPPSLDAAEMSQLVTYLWSEQVLGSSGRPAAGKKIFASNHCTSCHGDAASGAPDLSGRKGSFSAVSMVSSLWRHGPTMLSRMKEKNLEWPRFTTAQMSDLIAYLNSAE